MINNQIKTIILLGVLSGLLLGIGNLLGGFQGLTIAFVFVVGMNLFSYFLSDRIILFMYQAKEANKSRYPKLYNIVKEVAHLADIPMPKVYIINTQTPNAFATGRNPKHAAVACTEGILHLLSEAELRAVFAHEISHIKNRDILIQTIAATIAGIISYIAAMARYAAIFGGNRDNEKGSGIIELLVLGILTPIIATLLQLAISRSREYLADEKGAKLIKDPLSLASALKKIEDAVKIHPLSFGSPSTSSLFIVNPFRMNFLLSLLSTHPPTAERIRKLKAMAH
jgi:heat shock protein HtpX